MNLLLIGLYLVYVTVCEWEFKFPWIVVWEVSICNLFVGIIYIFVLMTYA